MKPQFEQVTVEVGESWRLLKRELEEIPFIWHYHPEFELTLTLNAQGQRYVGDSLQEFGSGDLVLTGPNQPHTWAATERPNVDSPMLAVVMWFTEDWLQKTVAMWPELHGLQRLADMAGRGLEFSNKAKAIVQPMILSLLDAEPAVRLLTLLNVLAVLATDADARPLATHAYARAGDKVSQRIGKVLRYLHENTNNAFSSQSLAAVVSMSVGAFHHFFKRHTGLTVLEYVSQLRIGQACQLLINTDLPIKVIAAEVGYGTLAHFNRQFLKLKQMTPTEFRRRYRAKVYMPLH